MKGRLRALFVSPRFLFPLDEGGKIRTANILRQMKGRAFEILLASPAPVSMGHFRNEIATVCDQYFSWPAQPRTQWGRISALIESLPVSVATDFSLAGQALIENILIEKPDLLLADFPHAAVLLPRQIQIPSVIFTHNVEAEILERHAKLSTGPRRAIWKNQARKMRVFEAAVLSRFDAVIAASRRDAERMMRDYGLSDVKSTGTGVDLDFYSFSGPQLGNEFAESNGTIVFVGVMDSAANVDAVEFLLDEIWPRVTNRCPGTKALIVGRNPPRSLVARAARVAPNFKFTGFVDDVRPYIIQSDVSVIPIRAASGTRLKAFEAMALGRPVVSTVVGMEGLDVNDGEHYLAADDAESFASTIIRLLEDHSLRTRLAHSARARLENQFSWRVVASKAEEICLETFQRFHANSKAT